MPMRLIFAGTPEFAKEALAALHAAGHDIVQVMTQPDRPAGRGMKLQMSPVKQWALAHDIPVLQVRSLRLDGRYPEDARSAQAVLHTLGADAMVVAAYGLLLPQWVLDEPRWGCLNIHASLLPRWRGAAPIQRAIEAGDAESGVTIMQMDAGLDTGDMLLKGRVPIASDDTSAHLHDKLAALGADLIVQALNALGGTCLASEKQSEVGACYAHKIEKDEARIDWTQSAEHIERRIRAFNPFPGASTLWQGQSLKVWAAQVQESEHEGDPEGHSEGDPTADGCESDREAVGPSGHSHESASPGRVLRADAQGIVLQCGRGRLRLTELQRAGGQRLKAADFLRGFALAVGTCMGSGQTSENAPSTPSHRPQPLGAA